MRWFVRRINKGERICVDNQYYKSKACGNIFKCLSEELNVSGKIYDIIEGYLKYKKDYEDNFEKEYESNFDDYRNIDIEDKEDYDEKQLGKLPIHKNYLVLI